MITGNVICSLTTRKQAEKLKRLSGSFKDKKKSDKNKILIEQSNQVFGSEKHNIKNFEGCIVKC